MLIMYTTFISWQLWNGQFYAQMLIRGLCHTLCACMRILRQVTLCLKTIWVFPKCFHWIPWIQIFVITVKGFKPATSCIRDQDVTTAPARLMWETRSLKWPQFMLQWFIWFPEFAEFTEFSFNLGKNPLQTFQMHLALLPSLFPKKIKFIN